MTNRTPLSPSRRLRALFFQLRAILVFVALAVGIVLWMLAGIVGAAIASIVRALWMRRRETPPDERTPRQSLFAPDSSSEPTRLGAIPPWLRA
jgi:hypothetical protein